VVTVTPYVQMRLLLRGTAAAAARVSVVAPFHVGAKFSKEGRRRTDLSSDPQFTAEVGLPEVSGAADSGFVVENSAVQWTQVNHSVHPLAPTIVATSTLAGGPAAFTVNAANVVGELLTD